MRTDKKAGKPTADALDAAAVQAKGIDAEVQHDLSLARVAPKAEDEAAARRLDLKLFMRLFGWTRPYAWKRNALFVIVVVRALQIPALAWAIGAVINGPILNGDHNGAYWGAAGFFALALFTQLTMHYRQRWALELGESVVCDLRNAVFAHLMRMPMAYYNRTKLGRIISRLTSDMEALRMGAQNVLFVSMVQVGQMVFSGALMVYYSPLLFSVILLMAPGVYLINRYFRKRIGTASQKLQESFSRVTASVAESVKGIQVTQGFAREQVNADIFRRLIVDHSGYNIGLARSVALYLPLLELNTQVFLAVIVIVGGYGVLTPGMGMEIGDLVAFFFLANMFFSPIAAIGRQFTNALTALAGAERVFSVLDSAPDWVDKPDAKALEQVAGHVEFDSVTFSYKAGVPVLRDLSFVAEPGQVVALVGHTGSGKSTIINLLSKFYLPDSGSIRLDGQDILDIRTASLRAQIAVVLQNSYLFAGSVRDNIRLGKLDASDAEIVEVLIQLNCLDLIQSLPDGLETEVGERGGGLSMGQRQVVCFARALLADPKIMILDEATASVDTVTEARLQAALETLMRGRTCFVVAHRLSTIRKADCVLVLDGGRLIEKGAHLELLERDGAYAQLYRQFVRES